MKTARQLFNIIKNTSLQSKIELYCYISKRLKIEYDINEIKKIDVIFRPKALNTFLIVNGIESYLWYSYDIDCIIIYKINNPNKRFIMKYCDMFKLVNRFEISEILK